MTRKIRPLDEDAERGFIRAMNYPFDELVAWAGRYEELAETYTRLAASELALREHETSRGKKWSATYAARRAQEHAERSALRARVFREIAEQTPTCELPPAE